MSEPVPPSHPDRTQILRTWSSITGIRLTDDLRQQFLARRELNVLAKLGVGPIETIGTGLWAAHGRLALDQWVLECDWPGVTDLHITSSEVRDASDSVGLVGGELVEAGLKRVTHDRNREILAARLGLRGEAVVLQEIGARHGISGERVRQLQNKSLSRLKRVDKGTVRRSWHHTRDTLRSALLDETHTDLAPGLVHSFVQLALSAAPLDVATKVVAYLCGQPSCDELVGAVTRIELDLRERRKKELAQAAALERVDTRVGRLADAAAWPERPHGDSPLLHDLRPRRSPVGSGRVPSHTGRWKSDKVGRAVGHESGIELQLIRLLDTASVVTSYCEQPVVVPYRVDGEARRYYPDLLVRLSDGRNLLVELKPRLYDFAIWPNQTKFAAATRFAHEHGWGFLAATEGTMTLRDLAERQIDRELEDHLRRRLATGPMGWHAVTGARHRFTASHNDIAAVIWRNQWRWQVRPYRLSASTGTGT